MYEEYKTYQIAIKTIESATKLRFSSRSKFDPLKNKKPLTISINNKDGVILYITR